MPSEVDRAAWRNSLNLTQGGDFIIENRKEARKLQRSTDEEKDSIHEDIHEVGVHEMDFISERCTSNKSLKSSVVEVPPTLSTYSCASLSLLLGRFSFAMLNKITTAVI